MKKDRVRDYATAAFRDYALYMKSPFEMQEPQTKDIEAVKAVIDYFNNKGKRHVVMAIEDIYFVEPNKPLKKNEITERVKYFAVEFPADESSVYRWLKAARNKFAEFRGLST